MRRYCLAEIALYAVLVLVARETRSEQGLALPVPVAEYRTSLPLRTHANGSYIPSEEGTCSVVEVSEDEVQVSQAYHCLVREQNSNPPLLLDGDGSSDTWTTADYVANCYGFLLVDKDPFITLTMPQNWCISTLNLTFYVDTQNNIVLPSNLTLQSSNTSAYTAQMDYEFTRSSHVLSDNQIVLSYELAQDVCDAYFTIELSGCREQPCEHYYLCEVDAFQLCSDPANGTMLSCSNTSNSTRAPSSQGSLPWYVQLFQGQNLVYVFIGLSALVAAILLLYICSVVACCVVCCRRCSRRTQSNRAEKDYAALEFLPANGADVLLTDYHKKGDSSTKTEPDASDSSIDLPDANGEVHPVSQNLYVDQPTNTTQEDDVQKNKDLPTSETTADEHECLPMPQCASKAPQSSSSLTCSLKTQSACGPIRERVQEPKAVHEPDRNKPLAVHTRPQASRTASGSQIIVPIAANGYAYLNAVHTTAEGYSYIETMTGSEHEPPRSERPVSFGGQLSSKSRSYANHDIIAQEAGVVQYGEKEYADIVIPEDPTKADPILSPKTALTTPKFVISS